jgi:isopenicillin-N N-acyltransferase like protein
MTPPRIDVLRVRGSHREVGLQIGEACRDVIREAVAFDEPEMVPAGRSVSEQLAAAVPYRSATARAMPWVLEELDAVAEAAGVDPMAVFAYSVEEIWFDPSPAGADESAAPAEAGAGRGCSDLVAVPPATANGHVLVGHNNDLSVRNQDQLIAIEWDVPGDPLVFTIGIGPWISVGFNSAGIALTGNELSPNDERVGVPRLLQVRSMLRSLTLDEALDEALRPDRASSYNNVLSSADGRVRNVEGSATDAEVVSPDAAGVLAHTNNYVCDRMLRYEHSRYAASSNTRYLRARSLLEEAASLPGSIDETRLRAMLSDHESAPESLCRHGTQPSDSKTVFWCVADVTERRVTFGRGNPCDSEAQEYAFA